MENVIKFSINRYRKFRGIEEPKTGYTDTRYTRTSSMFGRNSIAMEQRRAQSIQPSKESSISNDKTTE